MKKKITSPLTNTIYVSTPITKKEKINRLKKLEKEILRGVTYTL